MAYLQDLSKQALAKIGKFWQKNYLGTSLLSFENSILDKSLMILREISLHFFSTVSKAELS